MDPVLLDGFHAVKHALRFGATLLDVATVDPDRLRVLCHELAPDLAADLLPRARQVDAATFRTLSPHGHPTGVVAVAERPAPDPAVLRRAGRGAPLVVLDDPRHAGNVGAVVRVAAASGASGVVVLGALDPWSPGAVRGGAGLQFALPVLRFDPPVLWEGALMVDARGQDSGDAVSGLVAVEGPLLALDPAGRPLHPDDLDQDGVLAVGGERVGLSPLVLEQARQVVRLPMRAGVSSLNLATATAAVLYQWALSPAASRRTGA